MPSLLDYQPDAPVAEQPPTEGAVPPQEYPEYVPPPDYSLLNYDPDAPPPAPPPKQITPEYRSPVEYATNFGMAPPPANYQRQEAQAAPVPQPSGPYASPDAVPEDPFSGLTDPIRDMQQAQGLKDKAGALIGGYANATYNRGRDVVGQMAHDSAHYGDPYKTVGTFDPQGIKENPSNLLSAFPALINTLGGPHGPQDPTGGLYDFYSDPNNLAEADARYEQTQDIGVYYDLYEESQHRTLETGGLGGLGRGMLRSVGTDVGTLPMAALGAGAESAARIAQTAGKVGVARGIMLPAKAITTAYDPTDLGLTAAGKALPAIFGPTEAERRRIAGEGLGEILTGAALAAPVNTVTLPSQTPALPAPAIPMGPIPQPQPLGRIDPLVNVGGPAGRGPFQALDERLDMPHQRGAVPLDPRSPAATINKDITFWEDADGNPLAMFDDDAPITTADFDAAYAQMARVAPQEFSPIDNELQGWWSRMRTAMKQGGYIADTLPKAKREALGKTAPQTAAAGKRFVNLQAERIKLFGVEEVQRMLDDYQRTVLRSPGQTLTTSERAVVMKEALELAKFDQPVLFRALQDTIRYQPAGKTGGEPLVGATVSRQLMPADVPSYLDYGEESLLNQMMLRPGGTDEQVRTTLRQMLNDPAAFAKDNTTYVQARQAMYRRTINGKPISEGGEPFWVKPGDAAASAKYPAAAARYQAFYDAWKFRTGGSDPMGIPQPDPVWRAMDPTAQVSRYTGHYLQLAKSAPFWREMRKQLDDLGLRDVGFKFEPSKIGFRDKTLGSYTSWETLIRLHVESGYHPTTVFSQLPEDYLRRVVDHEAIHAMRDLGLFTDREWDTLLRQAKSLPGVKFANQTLPEQVQTTHADLYLERFGDDPARMQAAMDEELVAELFAWWRAGNRVTPEARTLLQRIYDVMQAIVNTLRGTDTESILHNVASGQIGARPRSTVRRGAGASTRQELAAVQQPAGPVPSEADPTFNYLGDGEKALIRGADAKSLTNWKRTPTGILQVLRDVQDELDEGNMLGVLAKKAPLDAKSAKRFAQLQKQYGDYLQEPWHNASIDEQVRVAAQFTADQWVKSLGPLPKNMSPRLFQDIGRALSNIAGFRRAVGLYNWAAAPRQLLTQYLGNAHTLALAKPSALISYGNLNKLRQSLQSIRSKGTVRTTFQQELADFGVGTRTTNAQRSLAGSNTEITGFLGGVSKVVAPKILQDGVSAPDVFAREVVEGAVWRRGMKQLQGQLPKKASTAAMQMNARTNGLPLGNVEKEIADLLNSYKTKPRSAYGTFTPQTLEDDLRNLFRGRPGVDTKKLNDFADRIARDWKNDLSLLSQQAQKEGDRVMFRWDKSRFDEVVGSVFLYHYWATHAGALYAKEFAKKPWVLGAYMRAAEQMQAEAEQADYPDWLKGFTRVLNSPAGISLFLSPMDMLGTAFTFADWQYGGDPNAFARDLTWLGQARNMSWFVISPMFDLALWLSGAYGGEDAAVPANLTGLDRLTALSAAILNHFNFEGMLPEGMGKDANGNPIPFAPRPLTDLIGRVGEVLGRPVPDPTAGQHANTKAFLYDMLLAEHPQWATDPAGSDMLLNTVNEMEQEALAGEPSEEWLEAERQAVELQVSGPDFPGLPDGLRPIFGAASRFLSPVRMTAQPETKFLIQHPDAATTLGADVPQIGVEDTYDAKDVKSGMFWTPEGLHLDRMYEGWHEGQDQKLGDAVDMYYAIGNGNLDGPISVYETTYSADDLAGLSEGRRYDIAGEWLNSQGYTRSDLDGYYEERDALETENPDLAGYVGYREYVRDYPGGPEGFLTDAVRTSPSFARWVTQTGYNLADPKLHAIVDSGDAYLALTGVRSNVYDPNTLPPTGTIPGMAYGENFAVNRQLSQLEDAANPSGFDEYVSDIEADVANIDAGQQVLDELYGPGVYRAGDYLPYDVYQTALAEWKARGIYVPKFEDAQTAYGYFDWLGNNATAPGHSVADYIDSIPYEGSGGEDPTLRTPEEIATSRGITLIESDPRRPDANAGIPAMTNTGVELRTGPGTGNPVNGWSDPGIPIRIIARKNGWSQVMLQDGVTVGWVPDGFLLAA